MNSKLKKFLYVSMPLLISAAVVTTSIVVLTKIVKKNEPPTIYDNNRKGTLLNFLNQENSSIDEKVYKGKYFEIVYYEYKVKGKPTYSYFSLDEIKRLEEDFLQYGYYGQEISKLNRIYIDNRIILDSGSKNNAHGRFMPKSNEIFINTSMYHDISNNIFKSGLSTNSSYQVRRNKIFYTLLHEYGHYFFVHYYSRALKNRENTISFYYKEKNNIYLYNKVGINDFKNLHNYNSLHQGYIKKLNNVKYGKTTSSSLDEYGQINSYISSKELFDFANLSEDVLIKKYGQNFKMYFGSTTRNSVALTTDFAKLKYSYSILELFTRKTSLYNTPMNFVDDNITNKGAKEEYKFWNSFWYDYYNSFYKKNKISTKIIAGSNNKNRDGRQMIYSDNVYGGFLPIYNFVDALKEINPSFVDGNKLNYTIEDEFGDYSLKPAFLAWIKKASQNNDSNFGEDWFLDNSNNLDSDAVKWFSQWKQGKVTVNNSLKNGVEFIRVENRSQDYYKNMLKIMGYGKEISSIYYKKSIRANYKIKNETVITKNSRWGLQNNFLINERNYDLISLSGYTKKNYTHIIDNNNNIITSLKNDHSLFNYKQKKYLNNNIGEDNFYKPTEAFIPYSTEFFNASKIDGKKAFFWKDENNNGLKEASEKEHINDLYNYGQSSPYVSTTSSFADKSISLSYLKERLFFDQKT